MSRKAETLSSLLRIALITLILGQGIPAPVYGAGDVNLRCRPPYAGNPNNVTSLTARTDFSIQRDRGKVLLEWTAPSDAGGNDVFSYVIRYATFSVTEAGGNVNTWLSYNNCLTAFDPDLPVSWGKYATAAAGTTQRYTLSGLDPGTYYYFAVQAIDRYNRHSAYDTQVQGVSTQANAYATTPPWWPYNITNLTGVSMPTPGYVSLQWSAPVFIDTSGFQVNGRIYQPGEYCIQYSTTYTRIVGVTVQDITLPSQINLPDQANNWVGSNRIYISTRNFNTGDLRSIVLSGLTNETTYYFHIFTRNEWPEWSYVSIPRCDVVPYISMPSVNGLAANDGCVNNVNIGHYVNVTWTNPNEPFISGVVVCYSSYTYPTSSSWPTRTVMTGMLPNQATGYTQTQLMPRTTYYYTVYAYDVLNSYSAGVQASCYTDTDVLPPDIVTNVTGLIGVDTTGPSDIYSIDLGWTGPPSTPAQYNSDYNGVNIYYSTSSANPATHAFLVTVPGTNGASQTYLHNNLIPLTTYYYSIYSRDLLNNTTSPVLMPVYISEMYVPPARPTVVTTIAGADQNPSIGCNVYIRWTAPTEPPQLGTVKIVARTDTYPAGINDGTTLWPEQAVIANTTYDTTFNQLLPNTTYFIAIYARSAYGVASRARYVTAYTYIPWLDFVGPFKPMGMAASRPSANSINLRWKAVRYNDVNFDRFQNPDTPRLNELYYYEVYRSTNVSYGTWTMRNRLSWSTTTFSETLPSTDLYFYKIRAVDVSGNYSESYIISTQGDIIVLNTEGSYMWLSNDIAGALFKDTNRFERDVLLAFTSKPDDEVGPIVRSIEWNAYQINESTSALTFSRINNFNLANAVNSEILSGELAISYSIKTSNGTIRAPSSIPINDADKWLSVYYYNGVEWLKQSSAVDKENLLVKTHAKFAGSYQLRKAPPATEFTFYGVMPRIVTPNADGQNDRVLFRYANPKATSINVKIFDLNGALVKKLGDLSVSSDTQGNYVYWDCTDSDNNTVPVGVYLYQFEGEGKIINGTVVVAR